MKNAYRKYNVIMVLCFIIGGFAITAYAIQAYSNVWNMDFFSPRPRFDNQINISNRFQQANATEGLISETQFREQNRFAILLSPLAIIILISGVMLVLGGLAIWSLTREKELIFAKDKITNILLLPEERIVIEELKKSEGQMTQSQLVIKTGLSKVKIHRVIKSLMMKGIVKKYEYGLTNKIILEKIVAKEIFHGK